MHIAEGVLSLPVLAGGGLLAATGLAVSLKRLPWQHLVSVSMLASAFFVASLIHVPLGPVSVHLIMNGLLGALLGLAAIPAIAVALVLQALLFQFGGISTLGVNICIMALPAVFCGLTCRPFFARSATRPWAAFFCGAGAVALSALFCAWALAASGDIFLPTAWAIFVAHLPVMIIEGLLTAAAVGYLARVHPALLGLHMQNYTAAGSRHDFSHTR